MVDIVFVNQIDWEIGNNCILPLGLLSLSKLLEADGMSAKICDFSRVYHQKIIKLSTDYYTNIDRMVDYLIQMNPYIISFYTMSNNYYIALSLCKKIKRSHSNVITILAGPQATAVAIQTLKDFSQVDLISIGEGEVTICKIVRHLRLFGMKNLTDVEGIVYRSDEKIVVNKNSRWTNVENLPILDFSQVCDFGNSKMSVLEMELGRGCPYNCTYCSTSRFWGRNYRIKSVDKVIREIHYYQKEHGTKVFLFQHDLFTFDKKYVMKLCHSFINNNLKIKWACYARLDAIDEEMIRAMSQAGCMKLFFGMETGSDRIQIEIKKNLDVNRIFTLLTVLDEYRIRASISFIYGFPQEVQEDLSQTLSLMYQIKRQSYLLYSKENWIDVFVNMLMYFADTEITDTYYDQLVFDTCYFSTVIKTVPLPDDIVAMIKEHKKIFTQYFVMPRMNDRFYRFLSSFINAMFSSFYCLEHNLVDEAIGACSGDVFLLYLKAYTQYPQEVENLYQYSNRNIDDIRLTKTLHKLLIQCLEEET